MNSALALVGLLSLVVGLLLLAAGKSSRGYSRSHFGSFSGPVWFVFLLLGIVLLALSTVAPSLSG
jgi:succinate dehydrogenase hydrophobic anchor subunit